jgi:hypothetical protein
MCLWETHYPLPLAHHNFQWQLTAALQDLSHLPFSLMPGKPWWPQSGGGCAQLLRLGNAVPCLLIPCLLLSCWPVANLQEAICRLAQLLVCLLGWGRTWVWAPNTATEELFLFNFLSLVSKGSCLLSYKINSESRAIALPVTTGSIFHECPCQQRHQ